MGLKLLLVMIAILLANQVNSEMANFPIESSELCSNITEQENNQHLSGVYRYYNETQQCHKIGEKGPCGELMIFYADPTNNDYGDCDCDHSLRCHRPLMYWPDGKRCYMAFDQGPCNSNQWFTFDFRFHEPKCEPNPCLNQPNNTNATSEFDDEQENELDNNGVNQFWFHSPETNECYKTNTQGPCTFPNEVVVFNGFDQKIKPRCTAVETICLLPKVSSLICVAGQKWAVDGNCQLKPRCTHGRKRGGHRHQDHKHDHHGHHRRPWTPTKRNFGQDKVFGGERRHHHWNQQQQQQQDVSINDTVTLSEAPQTESTETVRNGRWNRQNTRPYFHNHHHHFHNHSSVGPQWKRNSNLKRTVMGPRSRTNSNYVELGRVDFRNNGDEFANAGDISGVGVDADIAPSGEKK